jgi:hypothetical protein
MWSNFLQIVFPNEAKLKLMLRCQINRKILIKLMVSVTTINFEKEMKKFMKFLY